MNFQKYIHNAKDFLKNKYACLSSIKCWKQKRVCEIKEIEMKFNEKQEEMAEKFIMLLEEEKWYDLEMTSLELKLLPCRLVILVSTRGTKSHPYFNNKIIL